jgi:tRNA (guanosine-2'-O-)-methyltransferase
VDFAIAWDSPNADVDLLVTDPKGELVEVGRPSLAGLVKERDCPGKHDDCHGENYENVYLEGEVATRGRYRVRVRLERLGDDDSRVSVTLGARVGPKSYAASFELTKPEESKELVFLL